MRNPFREKETDLPNHLANGNADAETESSSTTDSKTDTIELTTTDYQQNEALNLLKGINILGLKSYQPQG